MIELPEAATIAKQLNAKVRGKRVVSTSVGSSPHKWVFYEPRREVMERRLPGLTFSGATFLGRGIHLSTSSRRVLFVDDFGGRVLFHEAGESEPKKYHLLARFEDDSFVTIAIQGWGFIALVTGPQLAKRLKDRAMALQPVGKSFTVKGFKRLFNSYKGGEKDPIKTFFTNGKNVAGIGNGYLQDILFRGKVDPRRKVVDITKREQSALHRAVKETVTQAIALGGRPCERDLFGRPGRYRPTMDRYAAGKPCPECRTKIQKLSYLGGSCYICPTCQR